MFRAVIRIIGPCTIIPSAVSNVCQFCTIHPVFHPTVVTSCLSDAHGHDVSYLHSHTALRTSNYRAETKLSWNDLNPWQKDVSFWAGTLRITYSSQFYQHRPLPCPWPEWSNADRDRNRVQGYTRPDMSPGLRWFLIWLNPFPVIFAMTVLLEGLLKLFWWYCKWDYTRWNKKVIQLFRVTNTQTMTTVHFCWILMICFANANKLPILIPFRGNSYGEGSK